MGKSFANFMCKKFFHPSSFANIKRVWLAEQRVKEETKKQDDLRSEYERDQDHYNNRQLMGDERVKHGLTFIYEAPKAYQREAEKDTDGKLEWKRAEPAQGSDSAQAGPSQDGGAVVRNVRCVRCHQMGHIPTDRECPMYKTSEDDKPTEAVNQDQLVEDMRRDGYAFKQSVLGRSIDNANFSRDLVADEDSDDGPPPEEAFLSSLTKKQKKKLLKKINRMEKRQTGSIHKKRSHKKRRRSDSSSSEEEPKKHHKKPKKHKRAQATSDEPSSSDEGSDGRRRPTKQSRRRRESSSRERDGHKGGKKRREEDSSSEDERRRRPAKMRDDYKMHCVERHGRHNQSIKAERSSEEDYHGRHDGRGQRRDYTSEDEDWSSKSKHVKQDRDRNSHSRPSKYASNESSHKSSRRDGDSRERETPRIKVEKDRRDDRRDREYSGRSYQNYSNKRDDGY